MYLFIFGETLGDQQKGTDRQDSECLIWVGINRLIQKLEADRLVADGYIYTLQIVYSIRSIREGSSGIFILRGPEDKDC